MKHIFLLILIICYTSKPIICQEKETAGNRILFNGLVMDASTLLPVPNTQILINRVFSSVSEKDGTFTFYVNTNDTVVFRTLGYKTTILNISDTLTGREFVAGIYLNSDTLSIGEVIIVPRFINLKYELLNATRKTPDIMENARYNVAVSAYQGRIGQNTLGDPAINYELLRQKQKVDAYERGGIPSDKIIGLSPLMLIPAAYLLIHGLPEKPASVKPQVTTQEIEQIKKKYLETLKQRK